MSKYHYQVQYVAKEELKKDGNDNTSNNSNSNTNNNTNTIPTPPPVNSNYNHRKYHDEKSQYQKKSNKFPRRNYSNEKKQNSEYELNQPQNYVYDSQTLLSHYKERSTPMPEIAALLLKIPSHFVAKPLKPISFQTNHHEDDNPEWMQETDFVGTFEFKSIEEDLELKRIEYQKQHGTYDKKQEEKKQRDEFEQQQLLKSQQLEAEKQKYREMKAAEQQQPKETETQVRLQQLFSLSVEPQKLEKFLTLEDIEKGIKKIEISKDQDKQVKQDKQKSINTNEKEFSTIFPNEDSFADLEAILGIKTQSSEYKPEPPPNQRIIPQEKIKTNPFSTQANLCQRLQNEPLWFYIDNIKKIQGGFPSIDMDIWYQQGYLMPQLLISWAVPGKWIYLDQFLQNLELVSQGVLNQSKAMEPSIDVKQQLQQQIKIQQQQQQQQQSQRWLQQQQSMKYQNNSNHNNNNWNNQYYNQYQQQNTQNNSYQQQQYQQPPRQKQNKVIFQIGQKQKEMSYSSYGNNNESTNGYIIDSKEFPSFDEK